MVFQRLGWPAGVERGGGILEVVELARFAGEALPPARIAGAAGTEPLILQQDLEGGDGGVKRTVGGRAALAGRRAHPRGGHRRRPSGVRRAPFR
jgi:hypothetical protein